MKENEGKEKISLYDCASLFGESMHEKFPNGCSDGSAIFLIATDGSRISSLIDGDDDLIRTMVAQVAYCDEELRNLIGNGLVAAVQELNRRNNETDVSTEIAQ